MKSRITPNVEYFNLHSADKDDKIVKKMLFYYITTSHATHDKESTQPSLNAVDIEDIKTWTIVCNPYARYKNRMNVYARMKDSSIETVNLGLPKFKHFLRHMPIIK